MEEVFLTAEWRKLVMANYSVDAHLLQPWLPAKTEIDHFDGHCFVSLVAFQFLNTRIRSYSIPFHKNFEEVNLRFYVRYRSDGLWKRGVVFIREFVPLPMVTLVANTVYDERYETVPTRHKYVQQEHTFQLDYFWKKRRWHSISVQAEKALQPIQEGSKEHFITQHFWGYSKKKNYTSQYQVAHQQWSVHPLMRYSIDVDFLKCYGAPFAFLNTRVPDSVFLAAGSPVQVFRDKKLF